MKKIVMAEKGPAPAGPFSHAVVANGFVFISGQGPVDPETGTMPDAFVDQVRPDPQERTDDPGGRGVESRRRGQSQRLRDPVRGVQRSLQGIFPNRHQAEP